MLKREEEKARKKKVYFQSSVLFVQLQSEVSFFVFLFVCLVTEVEIGINALGKVQTFFQSNQNEFMWSL